MRVLVTGINGQLGHDVEEILKIKGFEVTGTGTTDKYSGIARLNPYPDEYLRMDITDADDVRNIFMKSEHWIGALRRIWNCLRWIGRHGSSI